MKRFKWTVEVEVDATWVADGFDLNDEKATAWLGDWLRWAYGSEYAARVLTRPADEEVAEAQGYKTVAEYLHVRGRS